MFHRFITIILCSSVVLSTISTLHSGESVVDHNNNPSTKILDDYYNEFNQPNRSADSIQNHTAPETKKEILPDYYSDLLK